MYGKRPWKLNRGKNYYFFFIFNGDTTNNLKFQSKQQSTTMLQTSGRAEYLFAVNLRCYLRVNV